ncbi:MAG: sigma-54-dependent Fis family transcriptional regulator [Sphingobacteriia bacterium]|nr:sigma-54-dependent Fis family transcriptional regulator [Sphingobacteriia bacterium]
MSIHILIIDDEEKLRNLISRIIRLENYTVTEASSLKQGFKILEKEPIDIVLCDVKLPDGNGIDFVKEAKHKFPLLEVILLTAYGNIKDGVQAMKNGAFDYLTKGDDNDKLIPLLSRASEKIHLQKRVKELEKKLIRQYTFSSIVGDSPEIKSCIQLAQKVAPTDTTVLLLGETGTGKEVFAQAIHNASNRNTKPFVALNCSAVAHDILESEVFGHKAGAFTGAIKDKKGLIEEAAGGTLFLDEIGEMQVELQAKLLRFLENGEYIKVGDTKVIRANVRIIAATNRDLRAGVKEGKFREDLYYRLNVFTIALPALRERRKDILLIADHFTEVFAAKVNKRALKLSKQSKEKLMVFDWKGNIRELKNIIERAVIMADGDEITETDLPFEIQQYDTHYTLSAFDLASIEKLHIQRVLNHTNGNKTETARLLNIGLTTLYRKIEEYKLN